MNAPVTILPRILRMAFVAAVALASYGAVARAALLPPTMQAPAVPTPYCQFIGLTWQNQQSVPTSTGGLPVLQMFGIGVYQSRDSGAWSRIASLAPALTQYTVDPIQREISYRFRVRLEPSSGFHLVNHQRALLGQPLLNAADFTSPFSEIVTVMYNRVRTPSIVTCQAISETVVRVTWQEHEPGDVSSQVLVTSGNLQVAMHAVASGFMTFDVPNLSANRRYGFLVQSVDPYGNGSNFSTVRERATLATTPTSLRAMLGSNNIVHLSWNNQLENSGIQVLFATGVSFTQIDGNPLVAGVNNFPAATPGVALTNSITDQNVHFTVRAVNLDGVAGPSASPVTIASGPSPPTNRLIVRNNSQLPLRSVRIDGREMVISGFDVPAGGRGTIVMNTGNHNLHASGFNSMCGRNTLEFPSVGTNQPFNLSNAALTITIQAVTLAGALSQNGGMFVAEDGFGDWYGFSANGTWAYGYEDSVEVSGTFSGTYSPGISTVQMSYTVNYTVQTFSAVFDECDGTITLPIFNSATGLWEDLVYAK